MVVWSTVLRRERSAAAVERAAVLLGRGRVGGIGRGDRHGRPGRGPYARRAGGLSGMQVLVEANTRLLPAISSRFADGGQVRRGVVAGAEVRLRGGILRAHDLRRASTRSHAQVRATDRAAAVDAGIGRSRARGPGRRPDDGRLQGSGQPEHPVEADRLASGPRHRSTPRGRRGRVRPAQGPCLRNRARRRRDTSTRSTSFPIGRRTRSRPGSPSGPASRSSAVTARPSSPKVPPAAPRRPSSRRPMAVRHEAPCRIPNSVGKNLEGGSWV